MRQYLSKSIQSAALWVGVRALSVAGISPRDARLAEWLGVGNSTAAGVEVTEAKARTLGAYFACIRVIAETVGSLPLIVYRRTDAGGKERATEHPLYRLLHDSPNAESASMTFREALTTHICSWGNCYAEIERDRRGQVIALWPIDPTSCVPERVAGNLVYRVWRSDERRNEYLQPDEVLHVPGIGGDGVTGWSICGLARETIGAALATQEYGAKFFGNGGRPAGVLTHPEQLTTQGAKRLRESWEAVHGGGPGNSNKTAVLEEGMDYKAISIPPEDAQFIATRELQIDDVCRWFRMPPHKIGHLARSTFSNIEHQSIEFATDTIRPWLERWEQEFDRKLFAGDDQHFAEHLMDGILRGDKASRSQACQTEFMNGALTIDEWRAIENRNPTGTPEGQMHFVPVNLVPVEQLQEMLDAKTAAASKPAVGKNPAEGLGPDGKPEARSFNPGQPRDENGQWTDVAAESPRQRLNRQDREENSLIRKQEREGEMLRRESVREERSLLRQHAGELKEIERQSDRDKRRLDDKELERDDAAIKRKMFAENKELRDLQAERRAKEAEFDQVPKNQWTDAHEAAYSDWSRSFDAKYDPVRKAHDQAVEAAQIANQKRKTDEWAERWTAKEESAKARHRAELDALESRLAARRDALDKRHNEEFASLQQRHAAESGLQIITQ